MECMWLRLRMIPIRHQNKSPDCFLETRWSLARRVELKDPSNDSFWLRAFLTCGVASCCMNPNMRHGFCWWICCFHSYVGLVSTSQMHVLLFYCTQQWDRGYHRTCVHALGRFPGGLHSPVRPVVMVHNTHIHAPKRGSTIRTGDLPNGVRRMQCWAVLYCDGSTNELFSIWVNLHLKFVSRVGFSR